MIEMLLLMEMSFLVKREANDPRDKSVIVVAAHSSNIIVGHTSWAICSLNIYDKLFAQYSSVDAIPTVTAWLSL